MSRLQRVSVYGLLLTGALALSAVALPGGSLFREVTTTDLLTGGPVLDLPSLAVGGGLFILGLAAVALGLALLFARVGGSGARVRRR